MKATFRTILCAAAAMLVAVSCQKSAETEGPLAENDGTIDIRIGGLMGEYSQQDGTKAELVNTVRVSWKGGETVYVYNGATYLGELTAALEGTDDRYAVLSGTIEAPTAGTTLTLVHSPLLSSEPAVNGNAISINLATQTSAKAPFVVYATLDYDITSISGAVVPFQFATSVIKVNCTGLKANTAISKATLSNVNTVCKLTLSGSAAPTITGADNGTITRTGDTYFASGKVNAEGEAVFQIAVPKLVESATKARVLTVTQGEHDYKDWNFTQSLLGPATSVNTVCQLLAPGVLPGEFTVNSEGKKVRFSKGNLWADATDADNPIFYFEEKQYGHHATNDWDVNHLGVFHWGKSASVACAVTYSESGPTSQDDVFFTNSADFFVNGIAGYRNLSTGEFYYLLDGRTMENDKPCYTISGYGEPIVLQEGLFLYPDNYSGNEVSNSMTWEQINEAGIVFLPYPEIGGNRYQYWSSAAVANDRATAIVLYEGDDIWPAEIGHEAYARRSKCYIRLVTDLN